MRRSVLVWDRVLLLLLAVLLAALGLLGIAWWADLWPHLPHTVNATSVGSWRTATWWPWALLAAGIVLVLLGLRWCLVHTRGAGIKRLNLRGSRSSSVLAVDASSLAEAAASEFAATLGVRRARGRVLRAGGQVVTHIDATIEPFASLTTLGERADEVSTMLNRALGREDVRCRVEFRVAGRPPLFGARPQRVQ